MSVIPIQMEIKEYYQVWLTDQRTAALDFQADSPLKYLCHYHSICLLKWQYGSATTGGGLMEGMHETEEESI